MVTVTIEPATADRFDDVEHTFDGGGDGRSCQCQWWTLTNAQFTTTTRDEREQLLRDETTETRSPGLIAYVDGEPAGWVRVGPRTAQPRLARTRAYAPVSPEPWDDPQVWAISCFVVRREHRGQGLVDALLTAAVAFARDNGARIVEGYPVDVAAAPDTSANALFHGALSSFERAGFRVVGRSKPARPVVALTL